MQFMGEITALYELKYCAGLGITVENIVFLHSVVILTGALGPKKIAA
jgi:hypothetical protein